MPGRGSSSGGTECLDGILHPPNSHHGSTAPVSVIEDRALRIRRDGSLSKKIRSPSLPNVLLGVHPQDNDPSDSENREEIRRALQRQNVTISQLNLRDLELYGRESELSLLLSALEEVSQGGGRSLRPVIVDIQGCSGTGKTRLCEEFKKKLIVHHRRGFFLKGKYDAQHRLPYIGIVSALSDLSAQINRLGPLVMQTIRENLRAAVAEEATLLVSVVPALSVLFEDRLGEEAKSKPGCAAPFTTRSNRLHYVMRQLFKVICNADHPTVLVLDDMQWCDSSTLELLESIVTDLSLSHLLIVATCREEAQGAARSFLDLLATLRDTHRLSVRSIHLGNLDQSAVLSMVSTALRSSEERTVKLSEIVHQKSHGNPLYALQFLTRLYDDGLLKYSLGMMQWQWCDLRVRTRFVMDNVADLTSAKLQNLSLQKRTVLQIASCIGHTFGKEHLEFVIRGPRVRQLFVPEDDTWPADLDLCLTGLIEEAAIDFVPELKCYCFVHDTIHDAAFRLIPDVDRIKVQSEVGRRLLRSAEHVHCPRFSDMYFFRAVELSNSGALLLAEDEALELAKHNLEAGLRAISKAAFTSALKYMEEGLQLLGPSGWEKQPELVLNLVEGAAEASYCCGDFVAMEKHLESVLTRELPICDKVRCYLTRILSHGAQDRNSLALETGRKVLVEMKVSTLPMKPGIFHVFVELMKTKRCLKKYDQQSLLSLPNLENKKWYQAMSVVDMMNAIAYCSDINFFAVMNLRMMRWTLSHGVCQFSPTVFCTYGIILCGLGELKEAHKFGNVALSLSERLNARSSEAKTILGVYGLNAHWTTSLRICLKPLLYGHKLGMETGEVEIAMYNLSQHSEALLVTASSPLNTLVPKMRSNVSLMHEYKQEGVRNFYVLALQFALKLVGPTENPACMTGEVVDESQARLNAERIENMVLLQILENYCLQLAYYFGEYELADKFSRQTTNFAKVAGGHFFVTRNLFFRGLTALALAGRGQQRLHNMRVAHRILNQLKAWYIAGNVNCRHMVLLLQAESAAVRRQASKAARLYLLAINSSGRNGYLNDKALAHERAFLFHLKVKKDAFWAQNHYADAVQAYCDWNAYEKARHLIRCYGSRFELSHGVSSAVSSENLTFDQNVELSVDTEL